jgi:hypothetical protein
VTAVFNVVDGTEKQFTRTIKIQPNRSSVVSLYLVDGKVSNSVGSFTAVSVIKCNMQDAVKQVNVTILKHHNVYSSICPPHVTDLPNLQIS